jgi:hypothetical protein
MWFKLITTSPPYLCRQRTVLCFGSPAVYDETRSFACLPHDRVAITKAFPPTKDIDRKIQICQGLVQKKVVGLRKCRRC